MVLALITVGSGLFHSSRERGPERVRHSLLRVTKGKEQQRRSLSKRAGPFIYHKSRGGRKSLVPEKSGLA